MYLIDQHIHLYLIQKTTSCLSHAQKHNKMWPERRGLNGSHRSLVRVMTSYITIIGHQIRRSIVQSDHQISIRHGCCICSSVNQHVLLAYVFPIRVLIHRYWRYRQNTTYSICRQLPLEINEPETEASDLSHLMFGLFLFHWEIIDLWTIYIGSSIVACLWLGWIVCFVSWDEHRGDSLSIRKVIAATETEEEGQCDMENNPSLFVFSWDQKGLRDLWWIDLFGKVFEE